MDRNGTRPLRYTTNILLQPLTTSECLSGGISAIYRRSGVMKQSSQPIFQVRKQAATLTLSALGTWRKTYLILPMYLTITGRFWSYERVLLMFLTITESSGSSQGVSVYCRGLYSGEECRYFSVRYRCGELSSYRKLLVKLIPLLSPKTFSEPHS